MVKYKRRAVGDIMKDYLYNFYGESRVKSERRRKILDEILPHVIKTGISSLTISEVADVLDIERRTLYDYYPTKDDLIVDLAYISVNEVNDQYMLISETLNLANIDKDSKERLSIIMIGIAKVINEKYLDLFNFTTGFDVYFHHLDHTSSAYERYSEIIIGFKTKHHYLESILTEVCSDYSIDLAVSDVVEIFEQSFHAYLARTLIKQEKSRRYNIENIVSFIKILVNGLGK